jgi:hypothetical protein
VGRRLKKLFPPGETGKGVKGKKKVFPVGEMRNKIIIKIISNYGLF